MLCPKATIGFHLLTEVIIIVNIISDRVLPFLTVSAPHVNLQYFAEKFLHVFSKYKRFLTQRSKSLTYESR